MIPTVSQLLHSEGFRFDQEPFSPFCAKLEHEPFPFGSSLAAFFGLIYIQDRSSMLPPLALAPAKGARVLDMCASPGGKSGFLAQLAGDSGFVLANEPAPARLATLRANLRRANLLQAATSAFPGERLSFAPDSWPAILLDPPCSGWGTLQKNPKAGKIWRGDKIRRLEAIQKALLATAASLLAPGGSLLYSTCTTNYAENEAQTIFAENELGLIRQPLGPFPGFAYEERLGGHGCLLIDGDACSSQGFYLSMLRKPGAPLLALPPVEKGFRFLPGESLSSPIFDPSLLPPGRAALFKDKVRFIPRASDMLPPDFPWQGSLLGEISGSRFLPDPSLRAALPKISPAILIFEEIPPLRALLSGQSLHVDAAFDHIAIWWRDLPLCSTSVKNGRVLPPFRFN